MLKIGKKNLDLIIINAISARRAGGETNVINLLIELATRDVKVLVLANTENYLRYRKVKAENIKIFNSFWPSRSLLHRVIWELLFIKKIIERLGCKTYYNPGGTLLSLKAKDCSYVTTLQNMLPFSEEERKRYPLSSFLRHKLLLLKYLYIISYRNADRVVFPSKHSYNSVRKYIDEKKTICSIIYNGINDIFFREKKMSEKKAIIPFTDYYLYVSTFDYYKAQLELVREWKSFIDGGGEAPLVMIGHSSNEYKQKVLKLINRLGLEKYVHLLDPVLHDELPTIYSQAKALIFASSCESGPNILTEMMASRKPIFCSNYPPMTEIGKDSLIYFNPYLSNDLAEKIELFETNGLNFYPNLSDKAYKYAELNRISISTLMLVEFVLGKNNNI